MCPRGDTVVVPTPFWARSMRHHPEDGIALDSCIANVVQFAWERGVITFGSCCGHGDQPASLVLNEDSGMPAIARAALNDLDPTREWMLYQWQLCEVARA